MTKKSERRAAEMEVIEAATAFIRNKCPFIALQIAVWDYEKIGLEQPGVATIPKDGPDMSIQAGESLKDLGKLARQVFDEIVVVSSFPTGYSFPETTVGGMTVDQIEQTINRSHQSVSARVNELRNKGWIVDSGRKRLTRSRRSAIIWVPSQASRGRSIA